MTTLQQPSRMSAIVFEDKVCIPAWVVDLESFRRWARSGAMPEHGWFSYLGGQVWVDLSMEPLFTHNQVKTKYTVVLGGLVEAAHSGYFFSDRTLLSHPAADLSTEPDGLFFFYPTLQSGRIRLVEGAEEGYVELEGTPDMTLEIMSPTTVRKDSVVLRDLYWRAGVPEYWLVDARKLPLRFDIFRHTADGYAAIEPEDGWLKSAVFGRSFRLSQQTDPLGHPQFTVAVQP